MRTRKNSEKENRWMNEINRNIEWFFYVSFDAFVFHSVPRHTYLVLDGVGWRNERLFWGSLLLAYHRMFISRACWREWVQKLKRTARIECNLQTDSWNACWRLREQFDAYAGIGVIAFAYYIESFFHIFSFFVVERENGEVYLLQILFDQSIHPNMLSIWNGLVADK